ncbi:hypothetical protein [Oceanobacter antarcticus]|uniref:Uncharacterized protein n=1 Tax=Oceanobacter antarcticus TaxID=3133425 RepID=A0ABW8NDX1_9GAMM
MSTQGDKAKYETSKMEIEVPTVIKEGMEEWATQNLFGDDDENRMANLVTAMFVGLHCWFYPQNPQVGLNELEDEYGIRVATGTYHGRIVIGEEITLDGSEPTTQRPRRDHSGPFNDLS